MTLYELTAEGAQLYALLEDEQIDEQTVNDTLEAMGVGDKLEDYCKVIRMFEADAAAYKAEKDRFAAKLKRAENAIERMEKAISAFFAAVGKTEEKCGVFNIKVSQSKAAQIVDVDAIPAQWRKPQPDKIDQAGIRKALIAGEEIAGAVLQINDNVRIK